MSPYSSSSSVSNPDLLSHTGNAAANAYKTPSYPNPHPHRRQQQQQHSIHHTTMMDESDRDVVSKLLPSSSSSLVTGQGGRTTTNSHHHRRLDFRTRFDRHGRVTELTLDGGGSGNGANAAGGNRVIRRMVATTITYRRRNHQREGGGINNNDDNGNGEPPNQPRSRPFPLLYWDLDGTLIGKLDMLKKLTISHCRFLPIEALSILPHLESLEIHNCHGILMTQSVMMDMTTTSTTASSTMADDNNHNNTTIMVLPKVVRLTVHGGVWDDTSMEMWMRYVVTKMASLEDLTFAFLMLPPPSSSNGTIPSHHGHDDDDDELRRGGANSGFLVDAVVDALVTAASTSSTSHLPNTLRSLYWSHSGMTDHGLQRFMYEVLPQYPNLTTLSVPGNNISSLQFVLRTTTTTTPTTTSSTTTTILRSSSRMLLSTSLSLMNLQHNPIMKTRTRYELDRLAFELVLDQLCPFLGSLSTWEDWDKPIEGRLRINRAGGRILFRSIFDNNNNKNNNYKDDAGGSWDGRNHHCDDSNNNNGVGGTVPMGLWPILLERAYTTSSKGFLPANRPDATGLYYLVRNCLCL